MAEFLLSMSITLTLESGSNYPLTELAVAFTTALISSLDSVHMDSFIYTKFIYTKYSNALI